MLKVLHVYPQLNCGGTEMVIYNLIRFGNHDNFKFDILVQRNGDNEEIFRKLGCNIYMIPFVSAKEYTQKLDEFFAQHHYDVVHTHMHEESSFVLASAKSNNIKHRITHSHNARIDIPKFLWPLRIMKHLKYERNTTDLFGCSKLALKWLFPTRWKSGHVIYNGIDLKKFAFNPNVRKSIREKYQIADSTKVCINVGRCTDQKNQRFILDVAKEKINEDILFIIIGEGPLLAELKKIKDDNNLTNVWLLGKRNDITDWLNVADIFLFPSIYEGLGIVAIEAQASGLQVICTDNIPEEADLGIGSFNKLSLNIKNWAETIDNTSHNENTRISLSYKASCSQYDIVKVARFAEQIYST